MIFIKRFILLSFLFTLLGTNRQGLAAGKGEPAVTLDFEGELIEGEKKGPDLMFQTENAQLQLDAVLYNRSDFNDFHISDSRIRPRFSVTAQTPATRPSASSGTKTAPRGTPPRSIAPHRPQGTGGRR